MSATKIVKRLLDEADDCESYEAEEAAEKNFDVKALWRRTDWRMALEDDGWRATPGNPDKYLKGWQGYDHYHAGLAIKEWIVFANYRLGQTHNYLIFYCENLFSMAVPMIFVREFLPELKLIMDDFLNHGNSDQVFRQVRVLAGSLEKRAEQK